MSIHEQSVVQGDIQNFHLNWKKLIGSIIITELHLQTNLSPSPLDFAMLIPAGLLISAKPQSLAQPDILPRLNWNGGNWLSKPF